MLRKVKVDKLSFGLDYASTETRERIDNVIRKYYGVVVKSDSDRYNKLNREVTPTKQIRKGYEGFNHNLQMIPLDQFRKFLVELRFVARENLNVYGMHLAMDVLVNAPVFNYLETLLNHDYLNGFVASTEEADSSQTVYVAQKKKRYKSKRKQKLRIKFYDKAEELISRNEANRVLPLKEPVNIPELPMGYSTGGDRYGILLYKTNLLRCEIELRGDKLPFKTIDDIIETIDNGNFQNVIEETFREMLHKTVFAEPMIQTSYRSLKELAINCVLKSKRDYKLLCKIHDMDRHYNYFKKQKETVARTNDLNFEELREKLVSIAFEENVQNEGRNYAM